MNERDPNQPEQKPEPITFYDLPKPRQVRALQAYSESFRIATTTGVQRGGRSARRMRRAQAAMIRRAK